MQANFSVLVEPLENGIRSVRIVGELDAATVPELSETLKGLVDADPDKIMVDLTDCEFIDSTGLAALVHSRSAVVDDADGRFVICCAEEQVDRLLEITGLREAFGVLGTREDAIASFNVESSEDSSFDSIS